MIIDLKVKAMISDQAEIIRKLIEEGRRRLEEPRKKVTFETGIPEAEWLLNDLEHFPHLFVCACVMDRQIKAGRAWAIPYLIGKEIGGFEFHEFAEIKLSQFKEIFNRLKPHRFNEKMAGYFYSAVQDIHIKYSDGASQIWANTPKSALVIRRFLEFGGVGPKIANMAANILARDFKIPMLDFSSIDIAPDRQVKKFFTKIGLLRKEASNEELIYLAREIYPEYPGILDIMAWEMGRKIKQDTRLS
ncbi:MAG: iron-sulfur cluster loop [bacterium]|nr:iron-sulfur cluster loop [bacterium]